MRFVTGEVGLADESVEPELAGDFLGFRHDVLPTNETVQIGFTVLKMFGKVNIPQNAFITVFRSGD